jgi:hypothetical protein
MGVLCQKSEDGRERRRESVAAEPTWFRSPHGVCFGNISLGGFGDQCGVIGARSMGLRNRHEGSIVECLE